MVSPFIAHPAECPRPIAECCVTTHMMKAMQTDLKIVAAQRGISLQQLTYDALRTIAQEYRDNPKP